MPWIGRGSSESLRLCSFRVVNSAQKETSTALCKHFSSARRNLLEQFISKKAA